MKQTKAFTLTELMVVVVIIGILSVVAIPSYNKYALSAKYADAYVSIAAIQKAQIKHYTENGYFWFTASIGSYGIDGADGYIESKGKKMTINSPPEGTPSWYYWKALGFPIGGGTANFFAYRNFAGYWDTSGNGFVPKLDMSNAFFLEPTDFSQMFGTFDVAQDGGARCIDNYTVDQLGIQQANGKHFVIMMAGANFTEQEGGAHICTYVTQTIQTSSDGTVSTGPFVTINYGE